MFHSGFGYLTEKRGIENTNTIIMKKFLLLALGIALSVAAKAQVNATNPDKAEYYIKGYLSVEDDGRGGVIYKLTQLDHKGIYFSGHSQKGVEEDENVYFTLYEAITDHPGGFASGLQFWRYDEDIEGDDKWQTDSEFKPSAMSYEETKTMAVMLLIDCSSSLGADFKTVKSGALNFINRLFVASNGKGNIVLGIIGFSTIGETQVFPMRPLNYSNYMGKDGMKDFIENTLDRTYPGTALYYSMDKAVEMIEEYYVGLSGNERKDFANALMITFTDGLDQTSRNLEKGIRTTDAYYNEVKRLNGKSIGNNVYLCSIMRGVRGVDITTDAQEDKLRRIGAELTGGCNDKIKGFELLANVSQMYGEFDKIADNLITQWQNLRCYAPNSYEGKVAWTFRNAEKPKPRIVEKPREPKKEGNTIIGINVGVGVSKKNHDMDYVALTGGFDFAFPISQRINLGAYVSGGFEFAGYGALVEAGPLMLINFDKGGSVYLGGGYAHEFPYYGGADFRLGYRFKNGLYLFGDFISMSWLDSSLSIKMFNIGYSF